MLKNTETTDHLTFGAKPVMPPIMAVDPATNQVYNVASLIQLLKHPDYTGIEDLATKLDLFSQLTMQWCDEGTSVSTIREMMQNLFRLRDAFAGVTVTCQQQ